MTRDTKLEASLLIMRVAIAAFMLVWAIDKVIAPEHAQAVFCHFYFGKPSLAVLSPSKHVTGTSATHDAPGSRGRRLEGAQDVPYQKNL